MTRNEQIHIASLDWWLNKVNQNGDAEMAFVAGAKWADSTMIERACEWLQHNVYRFYWTNCTQQEHGVYIDKLLEQFKKDFGL